jgi:hypothetical protein
MLPRVEILEKVSRYEVHLSRQLFKAMHELEAVQPGEPEERPLVP